MRILVLWAHHGSANLGLHALAEGTAALVRRAWPDADVEFQDYGKGSAPMPISRPRALAREWVTARHGLKDWLQTFDLVIDTRSGDSFSDIYGIRRLFGMGFVGELVHRANVPLILGPQTIGPFNTRLGSLLAQRSLQTARLTMSRDHLSAENAASLRLPVGVRSTDVVFALPPAQPATQRDVVLNISGLLWSEGPHVQSHLYRETIRTLYGKLKAAGRTVSLLAHVLDSPVSDNDVPAIRQFVAENAPDAEVVIPESLADVRGVLSNAQLVIGSRMHACLNSLSVGTPAIALAYSRKFSPLFSDLGWHHTIDLRSEANVVERVLTSLSDPGLADQVKQARANAEQRLQSAVCALKTVIPDESV